jgi:hypothetical protein
MGSIGWLLSNPCSLFLSTEVAPFRAIDPESLPVCGTLPTLRSGEIAPGVVGEKRITAEYQPETGHPGQGTSDL